RNRVPPTTMTWPTTTRRPATTPGAGAGPTGPGPVDAEEAPSSTPPHPSTAAQMFPGGQAIPKIGHPSTSLRLHAPVPPLGSVLATTLPAESPATQSDADGQVSAWMTLGAPSGASTVTGEPQLPLTGLVEVTIDPF